jgi:precorrin-3B synthase
VPPPPASDACPGLLALHPARDGHVARIRLPGGYVTGPRWRALAGLARDFGDGHLDLTSRGNVQLRGLRPGDAGELARRAAAAGLLPSAAHDRARNIMASPLAGLDGRPPLRPLVRALDAVLLREAELAALPGRFLFSLDDGTGGAGLAACDVGLLCGGHDRELVVAGRLAGVRAGRRPGETVVAAAARAAIAAGVGHAVSRIADLPDGGASVAAALGGALGAPAAGPDSRLPLGPARAAGAAGAGPGNPERSSGTMVAGARLGRLTVSQAGLVADLLRPGEVIRLGLAGRIVIPLAARLTGARARLAEAGLLVAGDDPMAGVTACSGMACHRSVADVRAAAGPLPGHARTHWAGCARQCGLPPDAEPVIAVDADRYLIPGEVRPRLLATLAGAP